MSAPSPSTEVDICNLALARIGQTKPISSIEAPETPNEDLCAIHYPMTRRRLLRGPRIYNFAKKLGLITKNDLLTPAFGYAAAYALPNDFLRLLSIGDYTINDDTPANLYDIVDGQIYTNEGDVNDTLQLNYIFDQTLVARWDAIFVNLVRLELAKDMAYAFTLKPSLLKQLDDELMDVRLEAGAVAGQEKPPRRVQRSRLLTRRRMFGNVSRDTTRNWI